MCSNENHNQYKEAFKLITNKRNHKYDRVTSINQSTNQNRFNRNSIRGRRTRGILTGWQCFQPIWRYCGDSW